jgi:hypothetical protein
VSKGRQKIRFEGLLQKNVLGTFSVIRGFADLRDLAAVSVAIPYEGSGMGSGTGYQRTLDEQHVEDLKKFLYSGRYRFFPEVVLSLRSRGVDDPIVSYSKRRASKSDNAYRISVDGKALRTANFDRIHRIDGNHRLEAAKRLAEEQKRSALFKDFEKAPFCFIVLDSNDPADDELAEAMLFNLINSKALPILSEHSLCILMRDNGSPGERFNEDPCLYLTRWIRDKVINWPQGFYEAMGTTPLSRLHSTAGVLLQPSRLGGKTKDETEAAARNFFDRLFELAIRLRDPHEKFVLSPAFLPIAAEVYTQHSLTGKGGKRNADSERLRRAERWLRDFAKWFERVGGTELPLPSDPTILWTIFKKDFDQKARSVFIAMSFNEDQNLEDIGKAIDEAIDKYNEEHPNTKLAPRRIDKQKGASYEIPARVFNEIDQSRLVIADLTDEKPNVYCEVGYAKSNNIPFILTFHKRTSTDIPPWDRESSTGNKVHFDLAAYRYISYDNPLNLRDKLKMELDALFDNE